MIKLNIPERNSNPNVTINPSVSQVRADLDALPLANPRESCIRIHEVLHQLNRAPLDMTVREQIMAVILPLLDDLISSVRSTYLNTTLPLAERPRQSARIIQDLLTELSYGYKIIVQELLEEQVATGTGSPQFPQAIYYAMSFLARQLVDSYALYVDEPANIWLELNQLYLHAEKENLHEAELRPLNADDEPKPATIANTYRRIIMLSLANPYHLMQGEAIKMYKRLIDWVQHCHILPLGNHPVPTGNLFVDLQMDVPPLYAPNSANKIQPREGRLFEIKGLLNVLDKEIHTLASRKKDALRGNLTKRMERDMLFRWSESWGFRRERMSHRTDTQTPTRIVCSLTLAHNFISGEKEFKPEEQEHEIHGENLSRDLSNSLSLIPEEHTPWTQERTGTRPGDAPRTSIFETDEIESQKDIWVKVYSSSPEAIEEYNLAHKVKYDIYDAQIINVNQGGYGLVIESQTKPPARTGELVAAKNNEQEDSWSVGVIRWMKVRDEMMNLGVRVIADEGRAIAVKAVTGVGTGSEYYRALLAPSLDPERYPTTLITPAAVYDIGSIVILNLGDKILYAKLTRQLDSTASFSHYQFELVSAPEKLKTTTEAQEERKSARLFR
jgi:hypothetical protein